MLTAQALDSPQKREMKTPCLNLSLPISSPPFVQVCSGLPPFHHWVIAFLNPPDPTCKVPSCAILENLLQHLSSAKPYFLFLPLGSKIVPSQALSIIRLSRQRVRQTAIYIHTIALPGAPGIRTRIAPKLLWCSFLSFFLT